MNTPLKQKILRLIEASGSISMAEYVHICMSDPQYGYYQQQEPIGQAGDFITAPEVSQMFGELIGVWCIQAWKQIGKPESFNLVELGPGRGTMMADLLRTAHSSPEFLKAANIILVESSPKLRETQRLKLGENCVWLEDISDLPPGPSLIIANELLDVLPFRQYVKHQSQWLERAVGTDASGNLAYTFGSGSIDTRSLPAGFENEPDGSVFEYAPAREAIVQMIAERIATDGGAALLIDYGHINSGFGDTFQALAKHQFTDPLANPGKADLTNHVDFSPLIKVAKAANCHVFPALTQGEFLIKLGLLERAGSLGQNKDEQLQAQLQTEAERLALPDQMGDLFKCLAFAGKPIELPPFTIAD